MSSQSLVAADTTTSGMTVVSVSGYSQYSAGTTTTGTGGTQTVLPTIYGGYTGPHGECGASPASDKTCNSCGAALNNCNQTSIHPNLYLSITLVSKTTATFSPSPRIRYKLSNDATQTFEVNSSGQTLAANQSFTAQIKWSDLCQNAKGTADCDTVPSGITLSVGIDSNSDGTLEEKVDFNLVVRYVDGSLSTTITTACVPGVPAAATTEGICDYSLLKGDEKVYISDLAASSPSLNTVKSDVKFSQVIMFYSQGPIGDPNAVVDPATSITTASPSFLLNVRNNDPAEPSLADARIMGLQNDTKYCFALANVDQTGIISYFPNATMLADTTKVCAVPTAVVGLLDDKHCFVATATFGSPMAPEVVTFREFRNKFLLTNSWGRGLVKLYYKYGPIAAGWVSESATLRTFSLMVLWPLAMLIRGLLAFGFVPMLCFMGAVVFLILRLRRRLGRNRVVPL